ncbi:MAG TPA: sigma-70 family RNA polymerase sigma factor [Solirubrobacteraceae bacterium]|nr:sigma-70 family RNA polymerase sigma factor [Solirubrobacteraceae bacterium]
MPESVAVAQGDLERRLEQHRSELVGYCYRMLGSPFEAEDAVQDTFLRAWRAFDRFEGRAAFRSWLYRIATNVCLDMLNSRNRRARPMDFGPAVEPVESNLNTLPEVSFIEPIPTSLVSAESDPAELAVQRDTIRLAFVAALQHLPARQRAVLILCEVLRWKATEVAELLDTSVASVNSALQRARATLEQREIEDTDAVAPMDPEQKEFLERYVDAFQRYDVQALTALLREDATQSMPPFDLWLAGREDVLKWWFGPGIGCQGSRVIPVESANGCIAFGQYKPSESGSGYDPWALQVLEIVDGKIVDITFFLSTERLFPLWGLPPRLED